MIPLPCRAALAHAYVVAFSRVAAGRGVGSVQRCRRTTQPPGCAKRCNVCRRSSIVPRHTDLQKEMRFDTHIKQDKTPERTEVFLFWRCSFSTPQCCPCSKMIAETKVGLLSWAVFPPIHLGCKNPMWSQIEFSSACEVAGQHYKTCWSPGNPQDGELSGCTLLLQYCPHHHHHYPNCPWEWGWKTKRDKWDCYAIRYKAIIKKGGGQLKAPVQMIKSGCIEAENALLVPLPHALRTSPYQMASQSQMFPPCVIWEPLSWSIIVCAIWDMVWAGVRFSHRKHIAA